MLEHSRAVGTTINKITFEAIAPADQSALLWRVLDRCVVPGEQRARDRFSKCDISAALRNIDVTFPIFKPATTSIIGPLTTNYPALVQSLQVLKIMYSNCDESGDLCAFAALATHLRELTVCFGLTSVRGLEGHWEFLRKVNFVGCKRLGSIDALKDRAYLEEVNVSGTGITSIEPLRTCVALTKVDLSCCEHLSSIEALGGHQRLQEVDASYTPVSSIEPLRSCPVLTKVDLCFCGQLSSIEALENHQRLQWIDISHAPVTSIEPLRTCPALTKVDLRCCRLIPPNVGLSASVKVLR